MRIVFHGSNAGGFRRGIESLLGAGHEVAALGMGLETEAEREAYAAAEVIVGTRFGADLPRPRALRLFHMPGAGVDGIDFAALPPGATVCNCYGHEAPIAEYVMAALLLRHHPLHDADHRLRARDWPPYWAGSGAAPRVELGDTTVGLLGFGRIGKAVAARARAFGMTVTAANRSPVTASELVDRAFALSELHAFMGSADAIVASLPLTPETEGLVDAAALAAMRPTAIIVNVGRGPVIEERALFESLRSRRIAGAVIDTWYAYPSPGDPAPAPSALPFDTLDTVVMTSHMSGWTTGTIRRRQRTIAENIGRLERGEALVNVVGG